MLGTFELVLHIVALHWHKLPLLMFVAVNPAYENKLTRNPQVCSVKKNPAKRSWPAHSVEP